MTAGSIEMNRRGRQELSVDSLDEVVGGVTTAAAEDWWSRNRDTIVERAPTFMKPQVDMTITYMRSNPATLDVNDVKENLKGYGIDVDDLA